MLNDYSLRNDELYKINLFIKTKRKNDVLCIVEIVLGFQTNGDFFCSVFVVRGKRFFFESINQRKIDYIKYQIDK